MAQSNSKCNTSMFNKNKKGALTITVDAENNVSSNDNNTNKSAKNDNISSGKVVNASFTVAAKARNSTAHDL